jgi:antitoxin VapB
MTEGDSSKIGTDKVNDREVRVMHTEQLVHLEWVGRSQILHIPREFELASDDAVIRKEGDRLIVEPIQKQSLLALLATLEPIEDGLLHMPGR